MGKEGVRSGEKGSEGEGGERRRRIETKGKAKVVVSVWGAEIVQFLAALAILPRSISKKRLNSAGLFEKTVEFNRFFQNDRNKTASAARNLTNFAPQTDATTFALPSVSILLLWCGVLDTTVWTDYEVSCCFLLRIKG